VTDQIAALDKKGKRAKKRTVADMAVEMYLIEHGGAPFVITMHGKGKNAWRSEAPVYPDPMPTLAQAMEQFPCTGHGERKPAVCAMAKKMARGK
jgi:hypothetical protein